MRDSAPPEKRFAIPKMVPEFWLKKRATWAGLMPGTGMKVPIRYTIMAPIRNSTRARISPKRAASLKAAAGLPSVVFATIQLSRVRSGLVDDLAAGGFDRGPRALGGLDPLEGHGLGQRAREHDLGALGLRRHDARFLQGRKVEDLALDPGELAEPYFGPGRRDGGAEAHLGHPALDRHLAAFESHLVVAALARALSLDAATAGLALPGGGAASHPQPGPLGAGRGLHGVEFHDCSTFRRCTAARIMPRFSGVSATATVWLRRRSPRPRALAAILASWPCRLLTS